MATTHVFIVNEQTFPVHLRYMFAGTTAGQREDGTYRLESMPLLADIKRVHAGDKAIFYQEGVGFYGVFKVRDHTPLVFYDPDYLEDQLRTKLIYRTLIEADEVYSLPVSESEALDRLPIYSRDVLWSLIYRKLKGKRGCTPIFPQESDRLIGMIRKANPDGPIQMKESLQYADGKILASSEPALLYDTSTAQPVNCLEKLVRKAILHPEGKHETELQAYFCENAGSSTLVEITGPADGIVWIGNEVACGVGMQRIDFFLIQKTPKGKLYRILELKDEYAKASHLTQMDRYITWVEDFIHGTSATNIQPIIVAKARGKKFKLDGTPTVHFQRAIDAFRQFNAEYANRCLPLKCYEFEIDAITSNIVFKRMPYESIALGSLFKCASLETK